jgi:hypothetical protein
MERENVFVCNASNKKQICFGFFVCFLDPQFRRFWSSSGRSRQKVSASLIQLGERSRFSGPIGQTRPDFKAEKEDEKSLWIGLVKTIVITCSLSLSLSLFLPCFESKPLTLKSTLTERSCYAALFLFRKLPLPNT